VRRLLAALLLLTSPGAGGQEPARDGMGRDYWLYAPRRVEPGRTYWLVVGVHGMGGTGRGAGGVAGWADRRGDCLVVGPSFPSDGYQFLQRESDRQLIELVAALARRHRLHPKAYLVGFSGGAQFVHRFAHAHPERVVGYAAHSAGSWSTGGGWGDPNPAAKALPGVVTCGSADTARMAEQAPLGRLEWAQLYARRMREDGYAVVAAWIPGVGHAFSPEAARLSEVGFAVATGGKGGVGPEAEELRAALGRARSAR